MVGSGAWYSYNGERIGQGRENVKIFLSEHPEMLNEIEQRVLEHHGVRRQTNGGEETTETEG